MSIPMKNHSEIQRLLSAYGSGELTAAERALVTEHLSVCAGCRAELADLQTTLRLLQTTPEVEPPPWLTKRIMARVREEQAAKTAWWRRLFFPLQVKLPLEALALLLVCVTGYFLSRSVETELVKNVPQADSPATLQPEQKPVESVTEEKLAEPAAPQTKPQDMPPKATEQPAPQSLQAPAAAPPVTAPFTYAPPPPASKAERVAPSAGAGFEAKGAAPPMDFHDRSPEAPQKLKKASPRMELQERESLAPAPARRANSTVSPTPLPSYQVRLRPADAATAVAAIRQEVSRAGGTIIEAEPTAQRQLRVRMPAARLAELLQRLGRLGSIVEQPPAPSAAGMVEVVIVW